jgi:cytochrome oxidase Cu insertion factor (SCO1/SenC/PrrC family)
MPGTISNLSPASPILVSAFRSALLHQWLIIVFIFVLLLIAWGGTRTAIFGSMAPTSAGAGQPWREPRARLLLRLGFGAIWLFDGLLQAQPQMAGGLADQVMQPAASGSPGWVQHLVNYGVNLWDYHPIQAASASVWIQIGIGLWMILAVRGWSARFAGLAGVAWGLIVWMFGEAFGGIFAPGLTVLFGAPGAALIYVVAGALLALPERTWADPRRLGRLLLGGTGVFLLGMALLQAWPGRGFWEGKAGSQLGSLPAMIASMASTPQPHALDAIVSGFGNFTIAHGFAVNLIAVIALAALGTGLLTAAVRADARLARIVVIAGAVFCLADWALVEDLGFFGGLGTDPNSMIPFILLFTAGYLGLAPVPEPALPPSTAPADVLAPSPAPAGGAAMSVMLAAPVPDIPDSSGGGGSPPTEVPSQAADVTEPSTVTGQPADATEPVAVPGQPAGVTVPEQPADVTEPAGAPGQGVDAPEPDAAQPVAAREGGGRLRLPELVRSFAGAPMRVIAGLGALGVVLVGAAPMAFATTNPNANPITAESIAGATGQFDTPAPGFALTSQDGRQVSLASLRGKVVLLAFLDPVCTTDCPLIAQEMRSADTMLGAKASNTELVAVVANPTYTSVAYTREFTSQENLSQVPNWLYLTGSVSQLSAVWHAYGIVVEDLPAGAMSAHNDIAFVISANGTLTDEINDDPGPGTAATSSSFASLLSDSVLQTMSQS